MVVLVLIGGVMFVPFIGGLRLGSTGPVLTTRRLLQPALLRGWQALDLAAVAGIALRYHRWHVTVVGPGGREGSAWSTEGDPEDAAGWQHEWDLLAERLMGQAAIRIADQVRAVQGPDGPYETQHLELTAGRSSPYQTAYWTPARRLGSLS
jgi:hypothetical protein